MRRDEIERLWKSKGKPYKCYKAPVCHHSKSKYSMQEEKETSSEWKEKKKVKDSKRQFRRKQNEKEKQERKKYMNKACEKMKIWKGSERNEWAKDYQEGGHKVERIWRRWQKTNTE